jgi:hypothetical protein
MARTAALVGVADTPLRDGVLAEDGTVLQVQARAAKGALDEAGLALRDVDALFAAGSGVCRGRAFSSPRRWRNISAFVPATWTVRAPGRTVSSVVA